MKRITIISLMSIMFLGQSYAHNKQNTQIDKTVVMEQISPATYTTFKVSNNVAMYKVSFQNQFKMNVIDANTHPIQREFYEFYRTQGGEYTPKESSPELTTHPTLSSKVRFNNFYPFNDIETISPRPLLFITGDKAHSREFSEDAYKRAGQPKELVVIPNAGHVDLYDKTALIPFEKLDAFFTKHLNSFKAAKTINSNETSVTKSNIVSQ